MSYRIAVFICECGPNIKDAMDIQELVRFAGQLDGVILAETVEMICVPDARNRLVKTIQHHRITHLVFAGCSPKEHELTFLDIVADAGLNPFMMQVANIREQCAWVVHDRDRATHKAKDLIRGAVYRVQYHEPLVIREIDCCPDVLVIGAGVAGVSAARTLAQNDRKVFLLEQSPCIGGKVALYEDLFPDLNCAACLIEPDLDAVLHNDRIEVLTLSELTAIHGYPGNFIVKVLQHPRSVDTDRCIGCAACIEACPVHTPNEFNACLDDRAAIYIPYPGALPHVATIDRRHCLRFNNEPCSACRDACAFDAVNFDQSEMYRELTVGAVVIATGFHSFKPEKGSPYGFGKADNVITGLTLERLLNTSGPTGGEIVVNGRKPDTVAFVHCAGSRTEASNAHCSGVCCLHSIKHTRQVKRQLPEAVVHHLVADLCLPGRTAQRFYDKVSSECDITLHRMARPDALTVVPEGNNAVIEYTAPSGGIQKIEVQLVVLATAMKPPVDTRRMSKIMDIALDDDGFFEASHPITAPVASTREGIYLAGCCQGPMDIPAAVAQGQATAGLVLQKLIPGGKIALEPVVARVDMNICSGCRTCEALCPNGAVEQTEDGTGMQIIEHMCNGCGICAAACPGGAISVCNFSSSDVAAEIDGLLVHDKGESD